MSEDTVSLSVIIAVTRPEALIECLKGFEAQATGESFEVIAVGDVENVHYTPVVFDLLIVGSEQKHANVRRNIGISLARGKLIALMDDDAIPEPTWLQAALSIDPDANVIATGPETPVRTGRTAALVYAVCSNVAATGVKSHVNPEKEPVCWYNVPFCNCVIPRKIFDKIGLPSEDIPWDMDDFEFCARAGEVAVFVNEPLLAIRHDRYPDSIVQHLKYRFRLRLRTGEKLISHPGLYGRIMPVILTAVFPWAMFAITLLSHDRFPFFWQLLPAMYGLLLLSCIPKCVSMMGISAIPAYLPVMIAQHFITVTGVFIGTCIGLKRYGLSGFSPIIAAMDFRTKIFASAAAAVCGVLLIAVTALGHWESGPLANVFLHDFLHNVAAFGFVLIGIPFIFKTGMIQSNLCVTTKKMFPFAVIPQLAIGFLFVISHHPGDHLLLTHIISLSELFNHRNIAYELAAVTICFSLLILFMTIFSIVGKGGSKRLELAMIRLAGINSVATGIFVFFSDHL